MNQFLRFSISGLLGFFITAALFVGMLSLLSGKKTQVSTPDSNIKFSFVKDFKEAQVEPKPPRIKPEEPQKVKPTPTMPTLSMDPTEKPTATLPTAGKTGRNFNILKGAETLGTSGIPGSDGIGEPGGLKSAFPPMYPPNEAMNKTEGWVKVLISVNEFGSVSEVDVLQAKPARSFNAATIKAVKKWQFHPKIIDGKAMPFQVTQTIEFTLEQ
jgi:protein TonB